MFCHMDLSDLCLESKQIDYTLALQIMVDPPLQLMTFKLTIVYYAFPKFPGISFPKHSIYGKYTIHYYVLGLVFNVT